MWRQATVTVGSETADEAMVDFADRSSATPLVLEWRAWLDPDTEIKIGDETRYAGPCSACARQTHVVLLRAPFLPKEPEPEPKPKIAPPAPAATVSAEPPLPAPEPAKPKGKKS